MLRELDSRENDRITVRLLWNDSAKIDPTVSEFQVKVIDAKEGERFSISLDTFNAAREAYFHPYGVRDSLLKSGKVAAN